MHFFIVCQSILIVVEIALATLIIFTDYNNVSLVLGVSALILANNAFIE